MGGLFDFFRRNKKTVETKLVKPAFKPGQVWKYDNRPGDENSTITILKVDHGIEDNIVHIRIDAVQMHRPSSIGYTDSIGHLPYSETALARSVIRMVGTEENLPFFSEGYLQWKAAFDSGRAGVWIIEVKEAVEAIEQVTG